MKTLSCGILVLATLAVGTRTLGQQPLNNDDRPKITVNGEAVVNVTPDKIVVTLGIETSDKDISLAKQKNTEIMKKTVAAIKECGVAEKNIETDRLSIEPRWSDEYQQKKFFGYYVRNSIVVTLNDVAKVEELVTRVLQAGVTQLHGIDFQTTEFKNYREQARELALKAAREKAEKMAAVLGESIGHPLQISEGYGGSSWGYGSGWGGGRSHAMAQTNAYAEQPGTVPEEITDTIALGKLSIRANVTITFELKQ
jgi:uncharacterized protein